MLDIAILEGVRTPFAKAYGPLASVSAQDLGGVAAAEALHRAGLRPDQVDQVVFGNVALPADAANIARVIALKAGVPARPHRPYGSAQLRLRHGGDHHRRPAHSARRGEDRPGRRHRIDEPDPAALQSGGDGAVFCGSARRGGWQRLMALLVVSAAALQAGHRRQARPDRPGVRHDHGRDGRGAGPRVRHHARRSRTNSPWRATAGPPRPRSGACWPRRSCRSRAGEVEGKTTSAPRKDQTLEALAQAQAVLPARTAP